MKLAKLKDSLCVHVKYLKFNIPPAAQGECACFQEIKAKKDTILRWENNFSPLITNIRKMKVFQ